MCYNCGCGDPYDTMGHEENITEDDIQKASKVMGMTSEESKKNMIDLLQKTLKSDKGHAH